MPKDVFVRIALRFARSRLLPALFFTLTIITTLQVGSFYGVAFDGAELSELSLWQRVVSGLPFCLTVMAIISSHELGHYLTARRYGVRSSLPIFLPFPFSLAGTLGAFILIQSPFPNRRSLIDVGLAGPIAGFIVCIPALILGVATSRPSGEVAASGGFTLGEPLALKLVSYFVWSGSAEVSLVLSPIGIAAWFGLLLTAINLLPIGQLDGGHATYALFRAGAHRLSTLAFFALLPMSLLAPSWLFFALFTYLLGIRRPHPPTVRDETPLPFSRKVLGVVGLLTFVLSFTPEPIQLGWADLWEAFRSGG